MIGKYDNKRKEQKALLKELESIKSLLDNGELIDDDYSDLAEAAIKKSVPDEPLIHDEADIDELIFDNDDDLLISDELDMGSPKHIKAKENEIPVLKEIIGDDVTSSLPPGVLPGQQSLFNENKKRQEERTDEKATNIDDLNKSAKEDVKESTTKSARYQKPEKTENPFLPKHIRERLGGTIDIPAYAQPNDIIRSPYVSPNFSSDEGSSNNKATHNKDYSSDYSQDLTADYPNTVSIPAVQSSDVNQQEMIDALVREFMPKIESQLRLRLAKTLAESKK